eukprot:gene4991-3586_t
MASMASDRACASLLAWQLRAAHTTSPATRFSRSLRAAQACVTGYDGSSASSLAALLMEIACFEHPYPFLEEMPNRMRCAGRVERLECYADGPFIYFVSSSSFEKN